MKRQESPASITIKKRCNGKRTFIYRIRQPEGRSRQDRLHRTHAGILHYRRGYNIAVVDCDSPQHSIGLMRDRDMECVKENDSLKVALYRQHEQFKKMAYPIIKSDPEHAVEDFYHYARERDMVFDIVLFDLPGTLRSIGVIQTVASMHHIFIPLKADNVVMQSSLQFATVTREELIARGNCPLKGVHLFWNMIDKRERKDAYEAWNKVIQHRTSI